MISLKKNSKVIDLFPNTVIQRERKSPFFIGKDSAGKDGIPGETTFPFKLPATDNNLRILDFPHLLPHLKTKLHDCTLDDNGILISDGKLVLDTVNNDLNRNNTGTIDSHFLSNSSEFYKKVEKKKLKDLSLGGERTFSWNGYSRTNPGFWKHVHDTFNYINCDSGDYVFYPIANSGYLGGTRGFQNELKFINGANDVEINPDYTVCSLTPHIYVAYILKQIFAENGYALSGDPLNDYDFKKLTLVSFFGVEWSDLIFSPEDPDSDTPPDPLLIPTPLSQIKIKLSEHVPPTVTIPTFIVEMQKFLPIGFEFDDNKKTCKLYWLTALTDTQLKDRTNQFSPRHSISFGDGLGIAMNYGIKRNVDPTDLFISKTTINGTDSGGTQIHGRPADPVNYNYVPDDTENFIESNISSLPMAVCRPFVYTGPGSPGTRPPLAVMPTCDVEGSWHGKEELLDEDEKPKGYSVEYGIRFLFYRGKTNSLNDNRAMLPNGTNTVNVGSASFKQDFTATDGNWSLPFVQSTFGMIKLWLPWLKVIGNGETLSGILTMPLYEYLQLRWSEVLLINNTTYILQQIREHLPYPGNFQFQAVRKY